MIPVIHQIDTMLIAYNVENIDRLKTPWGGGGGLELIKMKRIRKQCRSGEKSEKKRKKVK